MIIKSVKFYYNLVQTIYLFNVLILDVFFIFLTISRGCTVSEILTSNKPWDAVQLLDFDQQLEFLPITKLRLDHEILVVLKIRDEFRSNHGDFGCLIFYFLVHSEQQVAKLPMLQVLRILLLVRFILVQS